MTHQTYSGNTTADVVSVHSVFAVGAAMSSYLQWSLSKCQLLIEDSKSELQT